MKRVWIYALMVLAITAGHAWAFSSHDFTTEHKEKIDKITVTGGTTGDVMTQQEDGTFAPEAPGAASVTAENVENAISGTTEEEDPTGGIFAIIISETMYWISWDNLVTALNLGGMATVDDAPADGTGYVRKDGSWAAESEGSGDGDVTGPASSVDGNIVVFDGITGKIIKDGGAPPADGADGLDGDSAYVYIAYASADDGTGFTTTFNAALDYIAILSTSTEIPSPVVGDFAGLWKNYKGAQGEQGVQGDPGDPGEAGPAGDPGADGADGYSVLSGSGVPGSGLGVDGDWYIDSTSHDIYGPKAAGAWGAATSLIGPQGEQGDPGTDAVDWTVSQAPAVIHADNYTDTNTTYTATDFDIKDLTDSTSLRSTWSGKADANQAMHIGTTEVAINRGSAALTLGGISLTTPAISDSAYEPSGTGDKTPTLAELRRGTITDKNLGASVDLILDDEAEYISAKILIVDGTYTISLVPPTGEAIMMDGTFLDANDEVDLSHVEGDKFMLTRRYSATKSGFVWDIETIRGIATDGGASD